MFLLTESTLFFLNLALEWSSPNQKFALGGQVKNWAKSVANAHKLKPDFKVTLGSVSLSATLVQPSEFQKEPVGSDIYLVDSDTQELSEAATIEVRF